MPLAKKYNINFTKEDLLNFEKENFKKISNENLNEVSGGISLKPALMSGGILTAIMLGASIGATQTSASEKEPTSYIAEKGNEDSSKKDDSKKESTLSEAEQPSEASTKLVTKAKPFRPKSKKTEVKEKKEESAQKEIIEKKEDKSDKDEQQSKTSTNLVLTANPFRPKSKKVEVEEKKEEVAQKENAYDTQLLVEEKEDPKENADAINKFHYNEQDKEQIRKICSKNCNKNYKYPFLFIDVKTQSKNEDSVKISYALNLTDRFFIGKEDNSNKTPIEIIENKINELSNDAKLKNLSGIIVIENDKNIMKKVCNWIYTIDQRSKKKKNILVIEYDKFVPILSPSFNKVVKELPLTNLSETSKFTNSFYKFMTELRMDIKITPMEKIYQN